MPFDLNSFSFEQMDDSENQPDTAALLNLFNSCLTSSTDGLIADGGQLLPSEKKQRRKRQITDVGTGSSGEKRGRGRPRIGQEPKVEKRVGMTQDAQENFPRHLSQLGLIEPFQVAVPSNVYPFAFDSNQFLQNVLATPMFRHENNVIQQQSGIHLAIQNEERLLKIRQLEAENDALKAENEWLKAALARSMNIGEATQEQARQLQ